MPDDEKMLMNKPIQNQGFDLADQLRLISDRLWLEPGRQRDAAMLEDISKSVRAFAGAFDHIWEKLQQAQAKPR